jgi:hypothetical protein
MANDSSETVSGSRPVQKLVAFSILYSVFMSLLPTVLNMPFPWFPLMQWADPVDVLTPFVMLPIYWILFKLGAGTRRLWLVWLFAVFAVFFVEGHGIHLSANSIDNLIKDKASDVYRLVYFYDEHLGHYLWTLGLIGLWALVAVSAWINKGEGASSKFRGVARVFTMVAALVYGFNYAANIVEAQTAPLGIPYAVLVAGVLLFSKKNRMRTSESPVLTFTALAYGFAALLFLGWGLYWHGMPEPSAVGIIP